MSPELAATHYGALLYPAEVLGDDALWAEVYQSMLDTFKDRDSELLARARDLGLPVLAKPVAPAALRALIDAVAARRRHSSG